MRTWAGRQRHTQPSMRPQQARGGGGRVPAGRPARLLTHSRVRRTAACTGAKPRPSTGGQAEAPGDASASGRTRQRPRPTPPPGWGDAARGTCCPPAQLHLLLSAVTTLRLLLTVFFQYFILPCFF